LLVSGDIDIALDARADLGEAPTWDADSGRLVWVDITGGRVHGFNPDTGRDEVLDVGRPLGAAVPTRSGRLALAMSDSFSMFDPATGAMEPVAQVEADSPDTTMNDGKCDGAGRFWAGTKDVEGRRPLGSLYRLDPDRSLTRVLSGITVSNGLGWAPDQRTMYYVDSPTFTIEALDFEAEDGSVSNRRTLVEFPEGWGLPDGLTVDEDGSLWVAFWTGSAVRRITPEGRVESTVALPVSRVTSCAFGGSDLTDLYVTTARNGLSAAALRDEPLAGGLFRLRPGVRGLPQEPFAG
jgi:sugar lactone lactonase YvrE